MGGMYRVESTSRRERQQKQNPSFSSTLLDQIYRSIDEGEKRGGGGEPRIYKEPPGRKQMKGEEDEDVARLRRARLIEKWMEKKAGEQVWKRWERKPRGREREDREAQDALFFSSSSSSSDSSSGGFSSSDTESVHGARLPAAVPCLRPVRTGAPEKKLKGQRSQRGGGKAEQGVSMMMLEAFDDYRCGSVAADRGYGHCSGELPGFEDAGVIKSKSRALKIYSNLKKIKQPISPGGRLANFINSLFAAGHRQGGKTKGPSSVSAHDETLSERKLDAGPPSACSSASSFSRSCLSRYSPSTREKLRGGEKDKDKDKDKRSVRFYPVSVILGEDCRPVAVPTGRRIGLPPARRVEDHVIEKSRRVEEMAREFLREYHQSHKKNDSLLRTFGDRFRRDERKVDEEEDDDDAESCSSSDLFELDHLAVIGNERFREELPVYETTRVGTNIM